MRCLDYFNTVGAFIQECAQEASDPEGSLVCDTTHGQASTGVPLASRPWMILIQCPHRTGPLEVPSHSPGPASHREASLEGPGAWGALRGRKPQTNVNRDFVNGARGFGGADQADWSGETPPLDSEPQEEAVQEIVQQVAAPEADQTACSPRGSARKFVASPQSGWHNLGRARSYASCANASQSSGYKNLVWNAGSSARGRCYGFASDVPEALERSCEDTYCWLFGLACQDQGLGAEAALAGGSDPLEAEAEAAERAEPGVVNGAEVVTAKQHGIDDSIDVGHIVSAEVEKKPDELKSAQALAPEEKNGHMKEIARRIQHFFQGATRRFRAPRAGAENSRANDSGPVQAQPQAAQQVGHAAPEVEIGKARDSDSAEAGSKTVQHANLGLVGRKEAGTAEARFSDPFDGEPQTPKDDKKVVTAEAGETDIMDYERELRGEDSEQ